MVEIPEQSSPHTVQDLRVTDWPLKAPGRPHLTAGSGRDEGKGSGSSWAATAPRPVHQPQEFTEREGLPTVFILPLFCFSPLEGQ